MDKRSIERLAHFAVPSGGNSLKFTTGNWHQCATITQTVNDLRYC